MTLWPTMITGFPGEFTSDDRVRFTRNVDDAWIIDEVLAEEKAKWWVESVRPEDVLYPRPVVDVLADELLHFSFADVSSVDVDKRRFTVDLTGMDGAQLATLSGGTAFLAEAPSRFNIDLAGVELPYRRQGFAGRLLYNVYHLAVALDITKVSLTAKLEDGPYVWPRFGFVPVERDWETAKPMIRDALGLIGTYLTPGDMESAESALASALPERIREIVRLDAQVPSLRPTREGVRPGFVDAGYALLAESGIQWYGVLDFEDDLSWALFDDRMKKVA